MRRERPSTLWLLFRAAGFMTIDPMSRIHLNMHNVGRRHGISIYDSFQWQTLPVRGGFGDLAPFQVLSICSLWAFSPEPRPSRRPGDHAECSRIRSQTPDRGLPSEARPQPCSHRPNRARKAEPRRAHLRTKNDPKSAWTCRRPPWEACIPADCAWRPACRSTWEARQDMPPSKPNPCGRPYWRGTNGGNPRDWERSWSFSLSLQSGDGSASLRFAVPCTKCNTLSRDLFSGTLRAKSFSSPLRGIIGRDCRWFVHCTTWRGFPVSGKGRAKRFFGVMPCSVIYGHCHRLWYLARGLHGVWAFCDPRKFLLKFVVKLIQTFSFSITLFASTYSTNILIHIKFFANPACMAHQFAKILHLSINWFGSIWD